MFDIDFNARFDYFDLFEHEFEIFDKNAIFAFILIDNIDTMNIQKIVEFFDCIFENLQMLITQQINIAQLFIEKQKQL